MVPTNLETKYAYVFRVILINMNQRSLITFKLLSLFPVIGSFRENEGRGWTVWDG